MLLKEFGYNVALNGSKETFDTESSQNFNNLDFSRPIAPNSKLSIFNKLEIFPELNY